jgi:hypothetical protein
MKTIKYLLFSFLFVSLFSCDVETEDIVTADSATGGVSVQLNASGKVLGAPVDASDLENTSITFTDNELDFSLLKRFAGEDITKYEVYKSLNGGSEVMVAQATDLPLTFTYSTIEDFYSGTEVSDPDDLRVGDIFKFRTKVTKNDGSSYFIHDGGSDTGSFSLTVSCSSDLAYTYQVITSGYYGTIDQGLETLVEKSPGLYKTVTTGGWGAGTIAPDQGFDFADVCGSLSVPDQDLCQGYYSNDVYQTEDQAAASFVDGVTGDLHIEYTISFGSGDQAISSNYIRQ